MKKNPCWMWRAIDGVSRASLGYHLGDHCDSDLQQLVDKVDNDSCVFAIDDWAGFSRILPKDRYFVGKDSIFPIEAIPIEATNSDLRHQLARFHRRSKGATRSLPMIPVTLSLYEHLKQPKNLEAIMTKVLFSLVKCFLLYSFKHHFFTPLYPSL